MAVSPPRLEVLPEVWLDARLALWLAASRVLIVADLHWGYVDSHRARGNLLPAWGDGAGGRLKLPALVVSSRRLVLPAFSPWAAGVSWPDGVPGETVYAIGAKRIFTRPPPLRHKNA